MTWPLAIICIVTVTCITIIVCAGQLWNDEWIDEPDPTGQDWERAKQKQKRRDRSYGGAPRPRPDTDLPNPGRREERNKPGPRPDPRLPDPYRQP